MISGVTKRRLADEYVAAPERGEFAKAGGDKSKLPNENFATVTDIGILDRAIRRAGELLKQIEPAKGGDRKSDEYQRVDIRPLVSRQQVAADIGILNRAIRRAGELLKQIEPAKPGPKPEIGMGGHTQLGRQVAGERGG